MTGNSITPPREHVCITAGTFWEAKAFTQQGRSEGGLGLPSMSPPCRQRSAPIESAHLRVSPGVRWSRCPTHPPCIQGERKVGQLRTSPTTSFGVHSPLDIGWVGGMPRKHRLQPPFPCHLPKENLADIRLQGKLRDSETQKAKEVKTLLSGGVTQPGW